MKSSSAAWGKFWKKGSASNRRVAGLLARARDELKKVHKSHKKAALIELPETFNDALTEISTQFENSVDNLDGLRPIISNLLEVIKSPVHLNNKKARRHVLNLLRKLSQQLHYKMNHYAEENEHQRAKFESLTNLFTDAVSRGSKLANALSKAQSRGVRRIKYLRQGVTGSNGIANQGRNIVDLRSMECRAMVEEHNRMTVRLTRVIGTVSQLQEVIADRWNSLKGFFIEKMEKTIKRKRGR